MKYSKLFTSILIMVAVVVLMQPVKNQIANLMNMDSDLAYLGPILGIAVFMVGGFVFGWNAATCVKEIKKVWQNKETGGNNA